MLQCEIRTRVSQTHTRHKFIDFLITFFIIPLRLFSISFLHDWPCKLVDGCSKLSFIDHTSIAASARANCSATPVRQSHTQSFYGAFLGSCLPLSHLLFLTIANEWKSNKCTAFESLSWEVLRAIDFCRRSLCTGQLNKNDARRDLTTSCFSWIKSMRLSHLQRSEPPWSRLSFVSRIAHPPVAPLPSRPSLLLSCRPHSSRPHVLQPRHLHPNPSTQSGERLAPGPLLSVEWCAPLSWPLDLSKGGRRDIFW